MTLLLQSFCTYDWDRGITRFFLLICVGLFVLEGSPLRLPSWPGPTRLGIVRILVALAFVFNLAAGLTACRGVYRSGHISSDQAQSAELALGMLKNGANPYGQDSLADETAYQDAWRSYARALGLEYCGDRMLCRPPLAPDDPHWRSFHSCGYKYGPSLLLLYAPFVALCGPAGFLLAHLLAWALLLLLLAWWVRRRTGSEWLTLLALGMCLWPSHLRWNALVEGHSDLPPTLLCLAFLVLRWEGFPRLAAVSLGLGLACKTAPALFFLPLLGFRRPLPSGDPGYPHPRRPSDPGSLLIPLGVVGLCYFPFLCWDAQGLGDNFLFPFVREPDSTALAYYIAPGARMGLAVLFGLEWLRRLRAVPGRGLEGEVDFLLYSVLVGLALGKGFHNNYLIWLLPLISLAMAMRKTVPAAEPRYPHGELAGPGPAGPVFNP